MYHHNQPPIDIYRLKTDPATEALNIASLQARREYEQERHQKIAALQAQQDKNDRIAAETGRRPLEPVVRW